MQPNSAPDIYLMKREKSRTGCMTVLIVTVLLAIAGGLYGLYHWHTHRGTTDAEPIEFPDSPVEAEIPPVPIVDAPAPEPVPTIPAPAPEPVPVVETPPAPAAADANADAAPAPKPTAPAAEPAPTSASTPAPVIGDAATLFAEAQAKLKAGDYQGARNTALDALNAAPGAPEIEHFLNDLAMPLLASERPMAEKTDYTVQSGDFLGKLAGKFNTPVALIAKANDIPDAMIRAGQTLRIFDGNNHVFALEVSKSRNDLLVTLDGRFFKRYVVSTGKNGKTPTGTFKITDKIAHPAWHKPGGAIPYGDPENLLGTHWLALDLPGYGIHGTWEPESLGQQASDGCIRLHNDNIEELYTILPRGTLVTIIE